MPFLFENLEVYKKAVDLADELSTITESFPKGNYYLSDQLIKPCSIIDSDKYC